jgi:nucleolin
MEANTLYVGNLSPSTSNMELKILFSRYGKVERVKIIPGRDFKFVEMSNQSEAEIAEKNLNGYDFKGRPLRVDAVRPPRKK